MLSNPAVYLRPRPVTRNVPRIRRRTFAASSQLNMRISAGKASGFEEGKMKEVPLDASDDKSPKVLVSKVNGKLYATSSKSATLPCLARAQS